MSNERSVSTISGALSFASGRLRAAGLPSPRLDAELLLGYLLKKSRTRLAIDANDPISTALLSEFAKLIDQRTGGEPVAYLTGHREFMGYDFEVGPGVLVPRPETELLVERAIEMIGRLWPSGTVQVLDLCTGSGAIALSLAAELRDRTALAAPGFTRGKPAITGSDVSPAALAYARKNRTALALDNSVALVEGDLLTWTDGPWDLLLTNPPYLRPDQIDGKVEIAAEPRLALDGGKNGIELIERILDQAISRVSPRFGMLIELDPDHADAVRVLASARFPGADVIIVSDLAGRSRFVSIEREESVA